MRQVLSGIIEVVLTGFLLSFGFAAGELVMKWAAFWALLHSSY